MNDYSVLTPANTVLAFVPSDEPNDLSISDLPNKLGITAERAMKLIADLDASKKKVFGDKQEVSMESIFAVMSYVVQTPQELAFLAFNTGKFIALQNLGPLASLVDLLRHDQ